MKRLRSLTSAPLLVAVLTLGGCSDPASDSAGLRDPGSATDDASRTASPSPPTAEPWRVIDGPLARCGPQPADVAETRFRYRVLRGEVGRVPSVRVGRGPVVAVLLHQTDGNGLCGWLPFAHEIEREGMAALAIDLCRYGESACRGVSTDAFDDADQVDPVELAVTYAREQLGARRVVVVGASMGGSVALMSAATMPGIDAVVDLSGPVEWPGTEVVREGRAVDVPVLLAMADDEGPEEVDGAAAIVANAPRGSRLERPEAGHGYELLADLDGSPRPFAADVLAWIRGSG
jgi:dienelactone hydrolase